MFVGYQTLSQRGVERRRGVAEGLYPLSDRQV
jgi:hypothetical protein